MRKWIFRLSARFQNAATVGERLLESEVIRARRPNTPASDIKDLKGPAHSFQKAIDHVRAS